MNSPQQKKPLFSYSHANRLRVGCEHIDKLLGEIEGIMHESSSKAAFPQYITDIQPAQSTCIEDHVALIRSRLITVMDFSGIQKEKPDIPASRAVRVRLASIQVSIDELRPKAMRSYGQMDSEAEKYLAGVVNELRVLIKQVDHFLSGSGGQNIAQRLLNPDLVSHDLSLLKRIEEEVTRHGLVEYRGSIASILDRIEDNIFEIAVFGRVSSGKSSLLNTIIGKDILPVGVTPVTALPVHIRWGEKPGISVSFVDKSPVICDISELSLYATEQNNPSNMRHVTRIIATLPAENLKSGIGFADTPGLGSLATAGAAETLAYLPTCDLGIVLIDAGSTITAEDIHTIFALQQAGVPVQILISKSDLLSEQDQKSLADYISTQIHVRSDERYQIYPVSTRKTHHHLLDSWLKTGILPLVTHAREMKNQSIQRKIGLLLNSIQETINELNSSHTISSKRQEEFNQVETLLRNGSARIEQTRSHIPGRGDSFSDLSSLYTILAKTAVDHLSGPDAKKDLPDSLIKNEIVRFVHQKMQERNDEISDLATYLHQILTSCASLFNIPEGMDISELNGVICDMPLYDPGSLEYSLSLPIFSSILGNSHLEGKVKNQIKEQLKFPLKQSLNTYERMYGNWMENTINELEKRYETYAGQYRAYISRMRSITQQ